MSLAPRKAWGVFADFVHSAAGGSVILLGATAAAMVLANSPWRDAYEHLLHEPFGVTWGSHAFALSLHHWVNDGLMAVFFFVVGLEIKREVLVGHLSAVRLAVLPGSAALGGMLVPAGLYALFNSGGPGAGGWGIPMATDIAFALGVLALAGAPLGFKVFLTALAIVDDLGAVLVIALFYTDTIHLSALVVAAAFLVIFFLLLRLRVRQPMLLFLPVIGVWAAVFASGLHATVAGILVALMVPMKSPMNPARFVEIAQASLTGLTAEVTRSQLLVDEDMLDTVLGLHGAAADLRPPGLALERMLHPFQAYVVLPLFAFFNAGITIDAGALATLTDPIALGVIAGLLLGKPLGIVLFSWLAVRSGLATLGDLTWRGVVAVSMVGAIGFTMSLFIGELAFPAGLALAEAKMGILAASLVAGSLGSVLVARAGRSRSAPAARDS